MKNKFKVISIVLFVSVILVFVSCGKKKTDWKSKIEVVDGVKVVHNFQPEQNEAFKPIEFVEDLSIGGEEVDENYIFIRPIDIDSDSSGNIYVLDYRDCSIKKYDAQGKHIKNIGRRGQGPGEFQMPLFLQISQHNKIYTGDILSRRIEMFSVNGDYLKTLKMEEPVEHISISQNDEFVAGIRYSIEEENKEREYIYKVCKVDSQMNKIFEIYIQKQPKFGQISDGEFSLNYHWFVKCDINSKNNIYVATANKYEINVFSSEGSLLFKFDLDFKPIPVTGEAQRKVMEILDKLKGMLDVQKTSKHLEFYPVFRTISIDEKDRIWVEHYKPYWRDKPRKKTFFNVFSSKGKFLFTTKIDKVIFPKLIFKNGYVYVLTRDESGFTKALRLRMVEN